MRSALTLAMAALGSLLAGAAAAQSPPGWVNVLEPANLALEGCAAETEGRVYLKMDEQVFAPLLADLQAAWREDPAAPIEANVGCPGSPAPVLMISLTGESAALQWPVVVTVASPRDRVERWRGKLEDLRSDPHCAVIDERMMLCKISESYQGLNKTTQYLIPRTEILLESGSPFYVRCAEAEPCGLRDEISETHRIESVMNSKPPADPDGDATRPLITAIEAASAYVQALER